MNNVTSVPGADVAPFDETETKVLRGVTLAGAGLSLAGSLFIVGSYILLARTRTFPFKLVTWLSISSLGSSLAYFIPACVPAAVMTQFFDVASFIWVGVIAYNIFQVLVRERGRAVEHNECIYHALAWVIPGALAVILALAGVYGDTGIWCWIRRDEPAARFFCYYVPLLVVFIYTSVTYIRISQHLKHSSFRNTVNMRLRAYVLVFVFVRVWSVLHRAQNYLSDQPLFWLALMHSLFSPLQGFANAIVYGCNRQVVSQYRQLCSREEPRAEIDLDSLPSPSERQGFRHTTDSTQDNNELEPISIA